MLTVKQKETWLYEFRRLTHWERSELIKLLLKEGGNDTKLENTLTALIEECGLRPINLVSNSDLNQWWNDNHNVSDVFDGWDNESVKQVMYNEVNDWDIDDVEKVFNEMTCYASEHNLKTLSELRARIDEKMGKMAFSLVPPKLMDYIKPYLPSDVIEKLTEKK